jgi:hypothetical protein
MMCEWIRNICEKHLEILSRNIDVIGIFTTKSMNPLYHHTIQYDSFVTIFQKSGSEPLFK